MNLTFIIPGPLREFAGGKRDVVLDVPVHTVGEALNILWERYPGLKDRVVTEQGKVRQHINIFAGDENIKYTGGFNTSLKNVGEIYIIPAVSGGIEFPKEENPETYRGYYRFF
jgi:sulfur-carrier protein